MLQGKFVKFEQERGPWQTLPSYLISHNNKKGEELTPPNNVTPSFILPAIAPDLQR